ncbi:MAG: thymidylate synthase [Clostridia bacterium]|nr:thymidylate synthase [Clostridia bacterium]
MSNADKIFKENCKRILSEGFWDTSVDVRPVWKDGTPAHTVKCFGIVNRYDLEHEFPIITVRRTAFKSCIEELLWIWRDKSNDATKLRSGIWDAWAVNGSIGKAYGYQLGVKSIYPEGEFDQVDRLLYDLKNNPYSRRLITNMYVHSDLHEMRLYPCAYSLTLNVSDGRLNGILNQRSQDMAVANNWNVCQYAVLLHMLAQVSGLRVGTLLHVIADAHIYDRHIPVIEELLSNEEYDAPVFRINPDVKNFYEFELSDFSLENYNYIKKDYKFEVAI